MNKAWPVQLASGSTRGLEIKLVEDLFHGDLGAEHVEVDTRHGWLHLSRRPRLSAQREEAPVLRLKVARSSSTQMPKRCGPRHPPHAFIFSFLADPSVSASRHRERICPSRSANGQWPIPAPRVGRFSFLVQKLVSRMDSPFINSASSSPCALTPSPHLRQGRILRDQRPAIRGVLHDPCRDLPQGLSMNQAAGPFSDAENGSVAVSEQKRRIALIVVSLGRELRVNREQPRSVILRFQSKGFDLVPQWHDSRLASGLPPLVSKTQTVFPIGGGYIPILPPWHRACNTPFFVRNRDFWFIRGKRT